MLGPRDVGHRVVVRRFVDAPDDRPIFTDLLGELTELTETGITVRTADGPVRVPFHEITRAKRIPDRRAPTATERLERIFTTAWPAPDQADLGDWLLRAAGGWTNRANSALAVGDPGRALAEAVEVVEAWYRDRGLPPKIMVPSPVGGRVTAELRRRGWHPQPLVLVQTANLASVETAVAATASEVRTGPAGADVAATAPEVRLDETPPPGWLELAMARKGAAPQAAHRVLRGAGPVRFAGVYDPGGAPHAIGRGAVVGSGPGRWLGLSLIEVTPARRRRGLARAISGALARWAAGLGAERAFLQVEEENEAAVGLYARLGFTTHHTYVTWRAP